MALGIDILGEEQNTAGLFVEPMNDTQAGIGAARVWDCQLLGQDAQHAIDVTPAGNAGQARRLLHGDVVLVFEENV